MYAEINDSYTYISVIYPPICITYMSLRHMYISHSVNTIRSERVFMNSTHIISEIQSKILSIL